MGENYNLCGCLLFLLFHFVFVSIALLSIEGRVVNAGDKASLCQDQD